MFQWLYDVLWLLAPIWIRRYLDKRSGSAPAYRAHRGERFGKPYPNPVTGAVWIHAVSVGETRAAQPLIRELRQRFPDAPLLMTQMTPTGRETAQVLFPDAQCRYLPYDKKTWVRQFLREHRPMFGILMETEIWPNLMKECRRTGVPLFLANARLSEKSLNGYLKVRSLIRPAAASLTGCLAQTEADAARLAKLGAASVQVCGNTKYDLMPSEQMKTLAGQFEKRIGDRQVAVCGSTRVYRGEDEAEKLLAAWQQYRGDALLVVVPRHPEHFQTVFETVKRFGFKVQRRSDGLPVEPDTQVWIGDSMGELYAYYLCADVAFVGGSLVDSGCQNIIEPLSCGVPTIFGFSTYNFSEACRHALASGAAVQVESADAWREAVEKTYRPRRAECRCRRARTALSHNIAERARESPRRYGKRYADIGDDSDTIRIRVFRLEYRMSIYAVAHIVHLYCAIAFVGGVFFEVLVLSVLHTGRVSCEARREVEKAMSYRAVRVMPFVVGLLFASGIVMAANRYLSILGEPFATSFGTMLTLKILLAFSVLAHFAIAVVKMARSTLTVGWSKYIHTVVFTHMLLIVFLAKAMFYISW